MVKYRVRLVCFLENVGLDQFENVASDGFHRFNHWIILGLLADDAVTHVLAIQVVYLKQVLKNVLQVVKINEASALSHTLIDFYDMIDCLNVLMAKEFVDICICVCKLSLEVLV